MAGLSFNSPATPKQQNRKNFLAYRRSHTLQSNDVINGRFAQKYGSKSKVIKSKLRLYSKNPQSSDREMYIKNYLNPCFDRPTNNNQHVNKSSLFEIKTTKLSQLSEGSLFSTRQSQPNRTMGLLNLVKSKGLTAIDPIKPIKSIDTREVHLNNTEKKFDFSSSKINHIKEWNLPEKSNIFKMSLQNKFDLIYPSQNEKIVNNNVKNIRESQLVEKLNCLNLFKSDRKSFCSTLKSFFAPITSFNFKYTLRQFIPYKHDDYEISENLQIIQKEEFVPFTEEMEQEIWNILKSDNKLIVTAFSINIRTNDLKTLYGSNWLNDAVIEFYMNLIALRSQSSVYAFGTFFFPRLAKGNNLGRWANKLDFFSFDLLLVPIHYASHWRLAIIDNKNKRIEYYDSLGNEFRLCVDLLATFLQNESINKKKMELDMSEWELVYSIPGIPLQNNSYDCGVFTCKYADYLARRDPITFTQDHIPYFRKCMMYEITHKKLLIS